MNAKFQGVRYAQCIPTKIQLPSNFRRIGSQAGALILKNSSSSFLSTILPLHPPVPEVIIPHHLLSNAVKWGPTTTWQVHPMDNLDCSENHWSQATTCLHHLTTKWQNSCKALVMWNHHHNIYILPPKGSPENHISLLGLSLWIQRLVSSLQSHQSLAHNHGCWTTILTHLPLSQGLHTIQLSLMLYIEFLGTTCKCWIPLLICSPVPFNYNPSICQLGSHFPPLFPTISQILSQIPLSIWSLVPLSCNPLICQLRSHLPPPFPLLFQIPHQFKAEFSIVFTHQLPSAMVCRFISWFSCPWSYRWSGACCHNSGDLSWCRMLWWANLASQMQDGQGTHESP